MSDTFVTTKAKVLVRCSCGAEDWVRVSDVLHRKSKVCRRCLKKEQMANMPKAERVALARKASAKAAVLAKGKKEMDPYRNRYGSGYDALLNVAASAEQRCTNPKNAAYPNYGGRGVEYRFVRNTDFAVYVLDTLGPRPSEAHSIDRIDNDRHYEPGNLRWATRTEQARNRRAYRLSARGERVRRLHKLRPDLNYETVRQWVLAGLTDADIAGREKYASSRL